ncbi:MAG: acyl-CoA dehydrogenase [Thermoleophilia bacterium]|nr:acyl-CoA dehydrogenase [Thermoleophilia bacterium]
MESTHAISDAGVNRISFERTDDQRELVAVARAFAQERLRPAADAMQREMSEGGIGAWRLPDGLLAEASAAGLLTYAIPEADGGGGLDPVTSAMLMEELTAGDPGLASLLGSAQLFAGGILAAGDAIDPDVRAHWLGRICDPAGAFAAIAFSEPHAGSDLANIRTRAVAEGDDWVLTGEKTWITGAMPGTTAMLVFARTGGAGAGGVSAFIVPGDAEGVTYQKLDLMGLRTSYTGQVFLDGVRVPGDHVVGGIDAGFLVAMRFFAHSRPQVAASALGIGRAAFEHAVQYANEREAFGKPIMARQGVSFMLADMGMQLEAARALIWRACDAAARGEDVGLIGSYAKAFASDVAMRVTTDAVQVLGGAGLSADHPVERWMRDAKVLQIVEGTNQVQRLIASRYYAQGQVDVP